MKTNQITQLFAGQWPQAILFDLDGTLVDSAPDLASVVDEMLRAMGHPPAGEALVRQWVGNGAEILVRRALANQFDHTASNAFDETDVELGLNLFFTAYGSANGRLAQVYPGVETFLAEAQQQKCQLGIVTNKPHTFTIPLLEQMALDHWFDIVVSGDSLPYKKPEPQQLLHAREALCEGHCSALMVGDSINDIEAAHNAGLPVVAVSYGYNGGTDIETAGADIVVDSLAELL